MIYNYLQSNNFLFNKKLQMMSYIWYESKLYFLYMSIYMDMCMHKPLGYFSCRVAHKITSRIASRIARGSSEARPHPRSSIKTMRHLSIVDRRLSQTQRPRSCLWVAYIRRVRNEKNVEASTIRKEKDATKRRGGGGECVKYTRVHVYIRRSGEYDYVRECECAAKK